MTEGFWQPGDVILAQEVWHGRVWSARPMTVVSDHDESLALWIPFGTRWKAPTTPPGLPRAETRGERLATYMLTGAYVHRDAVWDVSTLWLMTRGAYHAVWISWRPDGSHLGWYINVQEPYHRTSRGIEWMDLALDVVVEPDRQWRWKDEDEFALLVDRGLITHERAEAIRHEAQTVVDSAAVGDAPFCDPWPAWRPDPQWGVPALAADWDRRATV